MNTLRGKATEAMRQYGLANWALSMGRQRAGALTLHNHPLFLQNLAMPRLKSATGKIDVLALDIIRDRERGIPRYNEYRRQYGLKQLTSFDDFIDPRLALELTGANRTDRTVAAAAREFTDNTDATRPRSSPRRRKTTTAARSTIVSAATTAPGR